MSGGIDEPLTAGHTAAGDCCIDNAVAVAVAGVGVGTGDHGMNAGVENANSGVPTLSARVAELVAAGDGQRNPRCHCCDYHSCPQDWVGRVHARQGRTTEALRTHAEGFVSIH